MKKVYVYEDHETGNPYFLEEELFYDDLYCPICNDSDQPICVLVVEEVVENAALRKMLPPEPISDVSKISAGPMKGIEKICVVDMGAKCNHNSTSTSVNMNKMRRGADGRVKAPIITRCDSCGVILKEDYGVLFE